MTARIGIIGGGLMGRELACAIGRWFTLSDFSVTPELVAVCDPSESARDWFRRIPSVRHFSFDYRELLALDSVDVVYVAVPHDLHLEIYRAVLESGKDLMAEKPFGIDLAAADTLLELSNRTGRFVRCSSEFPFLPGGQKAYEIARSGEIGRLIEVRAGFLHSSDLDPDKPANWKRQSMTCGEIGVMGDLGLHVLHIPLRLGWSPTSVFAQLQNIYPDRPDGKGGRVQCDTWDNATFLADFPHEQRNVPMRLEMKRLSPGDANTWYFEALGTEGGVRFSTKEPKTLWRFSRDRDQAWERIDLGFNGSFPTSTGGIFETGFPDCFLQMWAAYLAERDGSLGDRFGCVTPQEAVASHRVFAAALESHRSGAAVEVTTKRAGR